MQHAGAGDRHLRHQLRVRRQEAEMIQHGMAGETQLPRYPHGAGLGLGALELDALGRLITFDTLQALEEVEMPPGAPELAVGGRLQADRLLAGDDLADLRILDAAQRLGGDLAGLTARARFLETRSAQQAADHIGAERRQGCHRHHDRGFSFSGS